MLNNKENIRIVNLTSILLMLLLSFGLLVFGNSFHASSIKKEKIPTGEILISKPDAAISSGIKIDIYQKNQTPNEGNFRLISFVRNQYFENKIVNNRITLLQYNWEKRVKIRSSLHLLLLFQPEKDEIPLLS